MAMTKVDSNAIHSHGYDKHTQQLTVRFNSGKSYTYVGVPPAKVEQLLNAKSMGKAFGELIRGKFPHK